jgi:hypothetical protein
MGYESQKRQQTADHVHALAKEIKRLLRRRSPLKLSVVTAAVWEESGSIRIELPWSLRGEAYAQAREELGRLMGFWDGANEISFSTHDRAEYVQRAAGTYSNPRDCGYCGAPEYRHQAPLCPRCDQRGYGRSHLWHGGNRD